MLVALGFLTRVPVGPRGSGSLGAAAWAFPLVGALVGLVVGAVGVGFALVLPVLVAAVLAVGAEVLLTGALHLDGLADCADGCGGRDRAQRLRIMKDHATGVYGTTAVVLDLLLKVALVHTLLLVLPWWASLLLLVVGYAVSRTALLPLARWLPSARPEGTGGFLVRDLTRDGVLTALGIAAGLVVVAATVGGLLAAQTLAPGYPGHVGRPAESLVVAPVLVLLGGAAGAGAVAAWARRSLGGVSGDVLGACAEVALLAGLVTALLTL